MQKILERLDAITSGCTTTVGGIVVTRWGDKYELDTFAVGKTLSRLATAKRILRQWQFTLGVR